MEARFERQISCFYCIFSNDFRSRALTFKEMIAAIAILTLATVLNPLTNASRGCRQFGTKLRGDVLGCGNCAGEAISAGTSIPPRYTAVPMLPNAATPNAAPSSPLVSDSDEAAPALSGGRTRRSMRNPADTTSRPSTIA